MESLFFEVGFVVLAASFATWVSLSVAVLVGRYRWERVQLAGDEHPLTPREAARLVRRAGRRRPRTEWGRWRRVSALTRLERAHHPAVRRLVRRVLADPDPRIASAAIRTLGNVGDDWALDLLVDALVHGNASRSRVAAELERLAPAAGPRLVPLLREWNPDVRFWAATLLGGYPELAETPLVELTCDPDANVRAAAVETLGARSGPAVGAALLARLADDAWFVRVHAARAVEHVVGAEAAASVAELLADERWWVRTAAKDSLRSMGTEATPTLLAALGHEDAFARNGAAEVLQDIGFVDFLAAESPDNPLLERIYAAGGARLREAAEARAEEVLVEGVRAA